MGNSCSCWKNDYSNEVTGPFQPKLFNLDLMKRSMNQIVKI